MDPRVARLVRHIEETHGCCGTIPQLAKMVNLSPSRLRRVFKLETGFPPAHYLRVVRLRIAKEFLQSTYLTVKEIVAAVGGGDLSHFLRDFRSLYGMSPTEYRNGSAAAEHIARNFERGHV